MPDPAVIAKTSPLLYLHQAGRLHLLQILYRILVVPPAVQEELEAGRRQGLEVPDVRGWGGSKCALSPQRHWCLPSSIWAGEKLKSSRWAWNSETAS